MSRVEEKLTFNKVDWRYDSHLLTTSGECIAPGMISAIAARVRWLTPSISAQVSTALQMCVAIIIPPVILICWSFVPVTAIFQTRK